MNKYIITVEQKTPVNPLIYATMAILARIGKQAEFKEAWEKLENAERNYICGDIYNIIKDAHPYNPQVDREKVLGENLVNEIIGTLTITEGFVPTAIRSEVMRLREKLMKELHNSKGGEQG